MTYLQALILSVVEGLTEFLPISSTGHLILTARLLHLQSSEFAKTFEIVIQLGAILAVAGYYLPQAKKYLQLTDKLLLAFLPSAIAGFLLYPLIKTNLLTNATVTLAALFLGGLFLLALETFHHDQPSALENLSQIDYRQALLIGLAQTLSVIPGVSRAAASIAGGLLAGLKHQAAVEFSFLLALPTIFAAVSLDLFATRFVFSTDQLLILLFGLVVSFVTAYATINFLLEFTRRHSFIPFALYRLFLAVLYYLIVL